jgi:hypothetical protein
VKGIDRGFSPFRCLVLSYFLCAGLLVVPDPTHAQGIQPLLATYDMSTSVTKTGLITDLTWANTHCVLFFDVKGDDGAIMNWAIELTNPRTMIQMGVTPAILAPGKEVTVTFNPSTNVANRGLVRLLKMDDKVIFDAFKNPADLYDKPAPPPKKKK